jgi:tyrosyl-tRNA synthetase
VAKDSVKKRMEGEGISYTEFSYALLQAYDFLELYRRHGCTLQMGGSDQWGNITAGMDLIRRVEGVKAHGLVMPLITTAAGTKFGKTESGTVWLDAQRTSPYEFYQYWLNTDDRDAVRYLKSFTMLDRSTIDALADAGAREPEKRHTQRALARDVTARVHGAEAVVQAEAAAQKLFSGDVASMSVAQLLEVFADVPSAEVTYESEGWKLSSLMQRVGAVSSGGEAVRLIRQGGVSLNEARVTDEKAHVTANEAIDGQIFVIGKGKKDKYLVRIVRA